jgi:predicted permease
LGSGSIDSWFQDLRYAMRLLARAPGFTAVTILTLALGIAANTSVFSLVNAWLIRPLPLKDPQQLISMWRTAASNPHEPAYFDFYRDYLIWAAENHSLQSLAATFTQDYTMVGSGEPQQLHGAVASWNLFSTVGAELTAGRLFGAEDFRGQPTCVISNALWRTQFGSSRGVIGRLVKLNDKSYRIVGVLSPSFSLRILDRPFDIDVWTAITADDPSHAQDSLAPVSVIGRLKNGVKAAQAEADLNAIQRELNRRFSDEPDGSGVLVAGLQHDNTRTLQTSLLLLWAAVAVLLLIACVNTGSLILGKNSHRAAEFAVRIALGCVPRRLFQQLTAEILLLFCCGTALGLTIAYALIRLFVLANPLGVLPAGGISLDKTVLLATGGIILVATLLFGSIPAIRALRTLNGNALRARGAALGRVHLRSRMTFVAVEIAFTLILLVSAGLLISSFAHLTSAPLGFKTTHVFVSDVALPASRYPKTEAQTRFMDELLPHLKTLPSVRAVGIGGWPFQANGLDPIDIEGRSRSELNSSGAFTFTTGPGYFDALGVPLLRGRSFTGADRLGSPDVAVVNEEFSKRYFRGRDPIGSRIRIGSLSERETHDQPWLTIVGVVSSTRSMRYNHVDWDLEPVVYTSILQRRDPKRGGRPFEAQYLYIYLQAHDVDTRSFADAVHAIDPDLPIHPLRSTGAIVSELQSQPRLRAAVLGGFAVMTMLMALVGIYGVIAQFVEQRRREIGIRIALGGVPSDVVRFIFMRSVSLLGGGLIFGVAGSILAARLLHGLLYGVSAFDPLTFSTSVVLLTLIGAVASYLPARRAAETDPNVVLRYE